MKTKEEIAFEWYSHSEFRSDLKADYKSFLEGYEAAQEEMKRSTDVHDWRGTMMYEGDLVQKDGVTATVVYKHESCQFFLKWEDNDGKGRLKSIGATYGDDTGYYSNHSIEVINKPLK